MATGFITMKLVSLLWIIAAIVMYFFVDPICDFLVRVFYRPSTPEHVLEVEKFFEEKAKAVEQAKSWSDEQVADEVRRFVLEVKSAWHDGNILYSCLSELEDRSHRAVLNLLGDSTLHERLITTNEDEDESPFARACKLLNDLSPAVDRTLFVSFLSAADPEVRTFAAEFLGNCNDQRSVNLLESALKSGDTATATGLFEGLLAGIKLSRQSADQNKRLYHLAETCLDSIELNEFATSLMVALDPDDVRDRILSGEEIRLDAPHVASFLSAFISTKTSFPHRPLQKLISGLVNEELSDLTTKLLCSSITLLGNQRHSGADDLLLKLTAHSNIQIARSAVQGFLTSRDLEKLIDRVFQKYKEREEKPRSRVLITREQSHYYHVFSCHAEIENGGFAQYFTNSFSDHWKEALAGFKAIGAPKFLKIVEEAIARFGRNGPSKYQYRRWEQVNALPVIEHSPFDDLDTRYYRSGELLEAYLARYVANHVDKFE